MLTRSHGDRLRSLQGTRAKLEVKRKQQLEASVGMLHRYALKNEPVLPAAVRRDTGALLERAKGLDPKASGFGGASRQVGRDLTRLAATVGLPIRTQLTSALPAAPTSRAEYRQRVAKLGAKLRHNGASAVSEDDLFDAVLGGEVPSSRIHQTLHKMALAGLAQARVAQGSRVPNLLKVEAKPPAVFGRADGTLVLTEQTKVEVSGGKPPYFFAWAPDHGSDGTPTKPTEAQTAFELGGLAPGQIRQASFTCSVRDSDGARGAVKVAATFIDTGTPQPLDVTVSTKLVEGSSDKDNIVTGCVTATPAPADGTLRFEWERVSGCGEPTDPMADMTRFQLEGLLYGEASGRFICTVHYGTAQVAKSPEVVALFSRPARPDDPQSEKPDEDEDIGTDEDRPTDEDEDDAADVGTDEGDAEKELAALLALEPLQVERLQIAMREAGIAGSADLIRLATEGRKRKPSQKEGQVVRDLLVEVLRKAGDPAPDELPDVAAIDKLVKATKRRPAAINKLVSHQA